MTGIRSNMVATWDPLQLGQRKEKTPGAGGDAPGVRPRFRLYRRITGCRSMAVSVFLTPHSPQL